MATDFESASKDALQMASALAKEFHSEIILLHVVPEVRGFPMSRGKIRKRVMEKLRQIEMDLRKQGISTVEALVRFGNPFERIIEHSEELDVNLITLGSGEIEEKFQLGTTAERVIIYANKPVFVVKRGTPSHIRRILCPVDFSESSERALKNAIYLSLKDVPGPSYRPHGLRASPEQLFRDGSDPRRVERKSLGEAPTTTV